MGTGPTLCFTFAAAIEGLELLISDHEDMMEYKKYHDCIFILENQLLKTVTVSATVFQNGRPELS